MRYRSVTYLLYIKTFNFVGECAETISVWNLIPNKCVPSTDISIFISTAKLFQVLDLSKTDIDNIPLDAFRGLIKLQQIDLSDNRFVTVPESLSLVGTTLEYLTFNNNPVVELNDDSFVGKQRYGQIIKIVIYLQE